MLCLLALIEFDSSLILSETLNTLYEQVCDNLSSSVVDLSQHLYGTSVL